MPITSRPVLVAILAVMALAVTACDDKKQGGAPKAGPVEVSAITVEPRDVSLFTDLPGRTVAFREAEVRPQVSGIILKRMFQEGSEVAAGQQLYQIDPATYQAAVESARANLVTAEANLKSIQAKAARYADLVQINAVSRQDYDDVVASLAQARAQILVAQAALDTARISLGYTRVYAPITGRIGRSSLTEGALVTADQTAALASITQLDPIYVDVSQSASDLLRLRHEIAAGQVQGGEVDRTPVTLTVDGAAQPYELPGQLQFSEVTVDQSTGAVQLRAVFPNPHHDLYPGLFVRARVEQGVKARALLVPQRSLTRTPDGKAMVWVVGGDDTVAPRPVEAGRAVGDMWVVDSGLKPGDRVVTEGLQKIRPGAAVHVGPADKS